VQNSEFHSTQILAQDSAHRKKSKFIFIVGASTRQIFLASDYEKVFATRQKVRQIFLLAISVGVPKAHRETRFILARPDIAALKVHR
jgi:hypothetical protein